MTCLTDHRSHVLTWYHVEELVTVEELLGETPHAHKYGLVPYVEISLVQRGVGCGAHQDYFDVGERFEDLKFKEWRVGRA